MRDTFRSVASVDGSPTLLAIIAVAGLVTGILVILSALAYRRRRTRQYLIVTVALFALWLRSVVGAMTAFEVLPMYAHHVIEHGLDITIGVLILYAVYAHAPGAFEGES